MIASSKRSNCIRYLAQLQTILHLLGTQTIMTVTYDPFLVIVSAFVAVLASWTALNLSRRVVTSQGKMLMFWLVAGAIALGTGIWSMHFLAMLAFSLPISINYNIWLVIISLIAAILASGQALFIVSRPRVSFMTLTSGAICMGVGIAAMHYIGMAAMQMAATLSYNPLIFLLSLVVAVVVSLVALKLFLSSQQQNQKNQKARTILQFISALIMGAAILLLHYTGMAAAIFKANNNLQIDPSNFNNNYLSFLVGISTFMILGTTLILISDEN